MREVQVSEGCVRALAAGVFPDRRLDAQPLSAPPALARRFAVHGSQYPIPD